MKNKIFNTLLLALLVIIIYSLLNFYILKSKIKLAIAHSTQHSIGILLIFFIGYFFFNQKINYIQILGIMLIIIGILMLNILMKNILMTIIFVFIHIN